MHQAQQACRVRIAHRKPGALHAILLEDIDVLRRLFHAPGVICHRDPHHRGILQARQQAPRVVGAQDAPGLGIRSGHGYGGGGAGAQKDGLKGARRKGRWPFLQLRRAAGAELNMQRNGGSWAGTPPPPHRPPTLLTPLHSLATMPASCCAISCILALLGTSQFLRGSLHLVTTRGVDGTRGISGGVTGALAGVVGVELGGLVAGGRLFVAGGGDFLAGGGDLLAGGGGFLAAGIVAGALAAGLVAGLVAGALAGALVALVVAGLAVGALAGALFLVGGLAGGGDFLAAGLVAGALALAGAGVVEGFLVTSRRRDAASGSPLVPPMALSMTAAASCEAAPAAATPTVVSTHTQRSASMNFTIWAGILRAKVAPLEDCRKQVIPERRDGVGWEFRQGSWGGCRPANSNQVDVISSLRPLCTTALHGTNQLGSSTHPQEVQRLLV